MHRWVLMVYERAELHWIELHWQKTSFWKNIFNVSLFATLRFNFMPTYTSNMFLSG